MREEFDATLVIDLGDAGCLECPAVYSVDAEWHGGSLDDWSSYRLEHFTLGDWRCTREIAVLALGDDAVAAQERGAAELWAETAEQQRRWAAQDAAE